MKNKLIISIFALALAVLLTLSACTGGSVSLPGTTWTPEKATDASGDEADLMVIYATHYSNYQGTLTFNDNGTFELWMGPGDLSDGTHSGTYELKDSTVNVLFDDDTQSQFDIKTVGDKQYIIVTYGGYDVYFTKQ